MSARSLAGAVTIVFSLAANAQQPEREPIGDKMVGVNLTLNLPVRPCDVPNIVFFIAQDLGVPAGGEFVPGPCDYQSPAETIERIPLLSLRLREALALLMKTDPRYFIGELDGVLVVRPLKEWNNDTHFLNTIVDRVELKDDNIGAALDALLVPLAGRRDTGAQLMAGVGTLSLSLGPVSVLEGLDAVVREHGAMRWVVSYCLPEAVPDVANVGLVTYNDRGLHAPAARRREINGKPVLCPAP